MEILTPSSTDEVNLTLTPYQVEYLLKILENKAWLIGYCNERVMLTGMIAQFEAIAEQYDLA